MRRAFRGKPWANSRIVLSAAKPGDFQVSSLAFGAWSKHDGRTSVRHHPNRGRPSEEIERSNIPANGSTEKKGGQCSRRLDALFRTLLALLSSHSCRVCFFSPVICASHMTPLTPPNGFVTAGAGSAPHGHGSLGAPVTSRYMLPLGASERSGPWGRRWLGDTHNDSERPGPWGTCRLGDGETTRSLGAEGPAGPARLGLVGPPAVVEPLTLEQLAAVRSLGKRGPPSTSVTRAAAPPQVTTRTPRGHRYTHRSTASWHGGAAHGPPPAAGHHRHAAPLPGLGRRAQSSPATSRWRDGSGAGSPPAPGSGPGWLSGGFAVQ